MDHARPLIALARLLEYPEDALCGHVGEVLDAVTELESADRRGELESLRSLADHLERTELLDLQAEYVETFDRGRSTSLNLYEHLYGEARARGPAMAELAAQYERAGLRLTARQLPDYLPAFLEYASTLSASDATEALRRVAASLAQIATGLERRRSPWLAAVVAALRFAGIAEWRSSGERSTGERPSGERSTSRESATAPDATADALDAAWSEPPIHFLGAADPRSGQPLRCGSSINGARPWR